MPIAGRRHDEPGVPVRSGHQPRERHPGPAFGRIGCLVSFLPPSHAAVPVVSAVSAHGDRRDATAAGAEGPGVRVVSEDDARRPELVDQGRRLSRSRDLRGAAGWRGVAVQEDGHGGQARQDLILADVGVLRPSWLWAGSAGVAVSAPVGGLAVRPGRFQPPSAPAAGQQPGQQVTSCRRARWAARRGGVSWAAMTSASLAGAGCAGGFEMTQPSGRFHRCTCRCPSPVVEGSTRSRSVRCRFLTSGSMYGGFAGIAAPVRGVHPAPVRCGFRSGSAADGQGIPASFRARVFRAALRPASRCANIQATPARSKGPARAGAPRGPRRRGP